MNKIIPFEIEYEAENEFSLEMLVIKFVKLQDYMRLHGFLKLYVKQNQTTKCLDSLSTCLRNAIKELWNNDTEDIVYCKKDWQGRDIFLSETFSMAYSARPREVILSSSFKNIIVSESDNSTITSVGEGCFIFVLESDCTVTVKGDNCFVYVAGDNNLVNIVGNNSKVIFSGKDNTLIIKGNSYFKGLSGSDIIFVNDEESQYEIGKIHNPKFVKDLRFETWYRFGYEKGSFVEVQPDEILY
jgi:hypothetical protein